MIRLYFKHVEWLPFIATMVFIICGVLAAIGGLLAVINGNNMGITLIFLGSLTTVPVTYLYFDTCHDKTMGEVRVGMKKQKRELEKEEAAIAREERIERLVMVEGYPREQAEKMLWGSSSKTGV